MKDVKDRERWYLKIQWQKHLKEEEKEVRVLNIFGLVRHLIEEIHTYKAEEEDVKDREKWKWKAH